MLSPTLTSDPTPPPIPLETGLASSGIVRAVRRALGFLPHGRELSKEDWDRRHRAIVALLWIQMVGLVAFGRWRGYSLSHLAVDGGALTVFAAWATQPFRGQRP